MVAHWTDVWFRALTTGKILARFLMVTAPLKSSIHSNCLSDHKSEAWANHPPQPLTRLHQALENALKSVPFKFPLTPEISKFHFNPK